MNRTIKIALAGATLVVLSACVAGTAEASHAAAGGDLSQLLLGFWHGFIAPVTVIIEVINRFAPNLLPWKVQLFEKSGTGLAYDVGFYFGIVGSPSLIWHGWSRRR